MVSKTACEGCRDDIYNHSDFGMNRADDGSFSCWCRSEATMVRGHDVPIELRPPYKHIRLVSRPSCWRGHGVIRVRPEQIDASGYWRR